MFFNIAVEKFGKKFNLVKLELSKEIFVMNIYNKVDYSIKQTSKLLSWTKIIFKLWYDCEKSVKCPEAAVANVLL